MSAARVRCQSIEEPVLEAAEVEVGEFIKVHAALGVEAWPEATRLQPRALAGSGEIHELRFELFAEVLLKTFPRHIDV